MNAKTIEQVVAGQQQLVAINKEIKNLRSMISQLLYNEIDHMEVKLSIHNKDTHDTK